MDAALGTTLTAEQIATELDISTLYRSDGPFITRCIERLSGRGAHVEDLLQETFVAAYKHRRRFDPDRASPRTWLYGIAANFCRTHNRGLRRFFSFQSRWTTEVAAHATPPGQPDEQIGRAQQTQLVCALLQRLPFKQREVFVLYELERLDGEHIARMLGVPPGTVWTRLHHARRTFSRLAQKRISQEDLR
jgi:RNA polymerase sigma-70 factor, ECF subfamily